MLDATLSEKEIFCETEVIVMVAPSSVTVARSLEMLCVSASQDLAKDSNQSELAVSLYRCSFRANPASRVRLLDMVT